MNYRKLGKTNIKVSEIAFGCEGFCNKSLEETKEMLSYGFKNGIN